MAENRQVRLIVRNRSVDSGDLPSSALMGEPFVNLYNGVLRFSGITGGDYEESQQNDVFEVGSKLFNSKIENRLSVNDNFVISGDTGIISTYGGSTGGALDGKFLSGTTAGFVLGNISDIQGVTDITRVQPGVNISTGGTDNFPVINLEDDISLNSIDVSSISADTIYSGSTDLYDIFLTSGDLSGTSVSAGSNVNVNQSGNDYEVSVVDSPSFNDVSFSGTALGGDIQSNNLSGNTIFSGDTNLENIFVSEVSAGVNINLGGDSKSPIINVDDSPVFAGLVTATGFTDTSLTQGRVVYVGASGRLLDEAGFEYEDTTNTLKTGNIQIGNVGDTGTTTTIYGDLLVVGESISGFTSELYIEDNLIELNFNPTASTVSTSLGAGFSVQDGSGVAGTDVFFDIRGAATGISNRGFATNLNDIYIREDGTTSSPGGVKVLAETDELDGGTY